MAISILRKMVFTLKCALGGQHNWVPGHQQGLCWPVYVELHCTQFQYCGKSSGGNFSSKYRHTQRWMCLWVVAGHIEWIYLIKRGDWKWPIAKESSEKACISVQYLLMAQHLLVLGHLQAQWWPDPEGAGPPEGTMITISWRCWAIRRDSDDQIFKVLGHLQVQWWSNL